MSTSNGNWSLASVPAKNKRTRGHYNLVFKDKMCTHERQLTNISLKKVYKDNRPFSIHEMSVLALPFNVAKQHNTLKNATIKVVIPGITA